MRYLGANSDGLGWVQLVPDSPLPPGDYFLRVEHLPDGTARSDRIGIYRGPQPAPDSSPIAGAQKW
jgi:hypothetical protein